MLKFGFHDAKTLTAAALDTFWGRRKTIAVDLYNQTEDSALQEQILRRFCPANGTFKRTYQDRFIDFDKVAVQQITKTFTPSQKLKVHDLAVSDGRTAVDFYKRLKEKYAALDYTASDYAPDVTVHTVPAAKTRVVTDNEQTLLQIIYPPFVFNMVKPERRVTYPINALVRGFLARPAAQGLLSNTEKQTTALRLLSPECAALDQDPEVRFTFLRQSIFVPLPGVYSAIRAMNILNPSYFEPAQINQALKHIYTALEANGILIAGSNGDAGTTVNGCIYQKTENGFTEKTLIGDGCPVGDLILAYKPVSRQKAAA